MKCIYVNKKELPSILPEPYNRFRDDHLKDCIVFPENELSMEEQRKFNPVPNMTYVITNSPFIVACFRKSDVLLYDKCYENPDFETYGASFEVIFKSLTRAGSLLPEVVVKDIRFHLELGGNIAKDFIKGLGLSGERAYLKKQLESEKSG